MIKAPRDWKPGETLVCLSSSFEPAFTEGYVYYFKEWADHFVIVEKDNKGSTNNGLHLSHFRKWHLSGLDPEDVVITFYNADMKPVGTL